jgi:hypothetical protein
MATLEKTSNLSDSHWYTLDGKPAYTIKKAKGDGDRPTTLRDARKHNLLPSVTTIFGVMAKPSLERWKMVKTAEAAIATERDADEPDERYIQRILARSRSETSEAAELGTKVHDALDNALCGRGEVPADVSKYVAPALFLLGGYGIKNLQTEKTVVNKSEGYAGRVDLIAEFNHGSHIVIDFKTRKTQEDTKVVPYEFQAMQIAAYAMAEFGTLENVYGSNLYISTTEIGRVEKVIYEPDQLQAEYKTFLHMNAMWRYIKNYDPRVNS